MAAVPEQARQAYRILHIGFVVAPVLAGLDKFFNVLVDWDRYLAPVATDILPVGAQGGQQIPGSRSPRLAGSGGGGRAAGGGERLGQAGQGQGAQ